MFSGKSGAMMESYRRDTSTLGVGRVVYLQHEDSKRGKDGQESTHPVAGVSTTFPVKYVSMLEEILDIVCNAGGLSVLGNLSVLYWDEVHFFEEQSQSPVLSNIFKEAHARGIRIVASTLQSLSDGTMPAITQELLNLDHCQVIHLTGICAVCKSVTTRTKTLDNIVNDQILKVGGDERYRNVCDECAIPSKKTESLREAGSDGEEGSSSPNKRPKVGCEQCDD
jgi:thymidine kinase